MKEGAAKAYRLAYKQGQLDALTMALEVFEELAKRGGNVEENFIESMRIRIDLLKR